MTALLSLALVPPRYPRRGFDPWERYPEYPFPDGVLADEPNHAYAAVREALRLLGLDGARFGTPAWNPLGGIVRRGARVVVKPNWVYHELPNEPHPEEILVTHPAVLRAVLDYVYIACGPAGRVMLADAPVQGAKFDAILRASRIDELCARFERGLGFQIDVVDLRAVIGEVSADGRVRQVPSPRPDPAGYRIVDLGTRSHLEDVSSHAAKFRCLDYDPRALQENHAAGRHRYLISGSVLDADAVINVPKLKTHGKSGVTASLKNLVGINGDKAFLPHFRTGSPRFGGDDYPHASALAWSRTAVRERLVRSESELVWKTIRWLGLRALGLASSLRKPAQVGGSNPYSIFSGHWHGNDTTWRMVLDLDEAIVFARPDGTWADTPQRGYLSIVDGIVAGERNGPITPSRRDIGAVFATQHPVAGDYAAAWLMGFDPERIPLLAAARQRLGFGFPDRAPRELRVAMADGEHALADLDINWRFRAPDGWLGHIERALRERAA
ncbi:MAG TPA: DUF362 domain-containing protein [Kofleriaceae bacterium]|nr:DUF362 domain-containing protein [Kofleriaceae bacterium]